MNPAEMLKNQIEYDAARPVKIAYYRTSNYPVSCACFCGRQISRSTLARKRCYTCHTLPTAFTDDAIRNEIHLKYKHYRK